MTKWLRFGVFLAVLMMVGIMVVFSQLEMQKHALESASDALIEKHQSFCKNYPEFLKNQGALPQTEAKESLKALDKVCEIELSNTLKSNNSLKTYSQTLDEYQTKLNLMWEIVRASRNPLVGDEAFIVEIKKQFKEQYDFHNTNYLLKIEIQTYNNNLERNLIGLVNTIFTSYRPVEPLNLKVDAIGPEFRFKK